MDISSIVLIIAAIVLGIYFQSWLYFILLIVASSLVFFR
jgi:hypothetical protein